VPVLVPEDTVPALRKLCYGVFRLQCGVNSQNEYLLSTTVSSELNVSGWHALNKVCSNAGVSSDKITATKMRHLASTLYASLNVPEAKWSAFYAHMGHSKAVNKTIYQAPLAEREVLEVGAFFKQFDLLQQLTDNAQSFPLDTHLLGDWTYPLTERLLVPHKDTGRLGKREHIYNNTLSAAHCTTERALAVLKGRFRQLKGLDMSRVDGIPQVIIACVLQNVCVEQLTTLMRTVTCRTHLVNVVKTANDDQTSRLLPGRQDCTNVTWLQLSCF